MGDWPPPRMNRLLVRQILALRELREIVERTAASIGAVVDELFAAQAGLLVAECEIELQLQQMGLRTDLLRLFDDDEQAR